jgi:hypothetical protein
LMVDEFKNIMTTITHGEVANICNHFQSIGDYACFPNSSGGAGYELRVVHLMVPLLGKLSPLHGLMLKRRQPQHLVWL